MTKRSEKTLLLAWALLSPCLALAESITLQGRVLDSSNVPLTGNVTFRVKILAPDASGCTLYDETQVLDLSASSGLFSIVLNDGSGTVNLPNTYSLKDALSNRVAFSVNSGYCKTGGGVVTYTPSFNSDRRVLISFKDAGMGSFEDMPEMSLTPSASALEAQTVGGYPASSLFRVENAGVPGTVAALSATDYTEVQSLVAGTSTKYLGSSTNTGGRLPSLGGTPAGATAGSIWYESGSIKFHNGTTVQTLGTGGGTGDIDGVTAGTGLSGGGTSGTVTLSLATSGATAATYGSATAVPVITVDAYGRITSATTAAVSGGASGGAGGDLSGTYPNPTVAKIQGSSVASTTPTSGQFLKFGTSWDPAHITLGDLKSSVSGSLFSSPNCTSSQTLSWNSVSDQFSCQSISVAGSSFGSQTANTVLAAPDGSAGNPSFRALVAADIPNLAWSKITSGKPTTLSGYGVTDGVQNAGGVVSMAAGTDASRPAAGTAGRLYLATDGQKLYRDNGTTWDTIASVSSGTGDFLKDGSVAMTGTFKGYAGAANLPGITFSGDTDTGLYSLAADTIGFSTNGAVKMRLNSSGNLGIGADPTARLHVETAGSSANETAMVVSNPSTAAWSTVNYNFHTAGAWKGAFWTMRDDTGSGAHFGVSTANTSGTAVERLRILPSGRMNLGPSGNPTEMLEVEGGIRASGQLSTGSQVISSGATTAIDWNNGNSISTNYNCGSAFAFANLRDGGTYTLVVTDSATTQCSFSTTTTGNGAGTVSYRFKPTNAARTASSHTVYTLMRVGDIVYVSWASGF